MRETEVTCIIFLTVSPTGRGFPHERSASWTPRDPKFVEDARTTVLKPDLAFLEHAPLEPARNIAKKRPVVVTGHLFGRWIAATVFFKRRSEITNATLFKEKH